MEEGLDWVLYVPIDFFLYLFTFFAGLCGFVAVVVGGGISAFTVHYIANPILVVLFLDPFLAITKLPVDQSIGVSPVNSSLSAGRAPALHAGGRRFDPAWLHHFCLSSFWLNSVPSASFFTSSHAGFGWCD